MLYPGFCINLDYSIYTVNPTKLFFPLQFNLTIFDYDYTNPKNLFGVNDQFWHSAIGPMSKWANSVTQNACLQCSNYLNFANLCTKQISLAFILMSGKCKSTCGKTLNDQRHLWRIGNLRRLHLTLRGHFGWLYAIFFPRFWLNWAGLFWPGAIK